MYGDYANLDHTEIAASYWAEIGVDVEIEVLTSAEVAERLFSSTDEHSGYEGMMGSIAGGLYDPVMMVGWFRSDATWNRPLHQWPEVDVMVDAALAATTIEEQQRLIAEADMYMIEKHWQIWAPKSPRLILAQPWLIGYDGEAGDWAAGEI